MSTNSTVKGIIIIVVDFSAPDFSAPDSIEGADRTGARA
jgi:hypothetical protein